jgi:hypothetical protein
MQGFLKESERLYKDDPHPRGYLEEKYRKKMN